MGTRTKYWDGTKLVLGRWRSYWLRVAPHDYRRASHASARVTQMVDRRFSPSVRGPAKGNFDVRSRSTLIEEDDVARIKTALERAGIEFTKARNRPCG